MRDALTRHCSGKIASENFLELAIRDARAVGVSRLARLTGLDDVGVEVFQSVRPASRNFVVSQGKGFDEPSARIGALCEAIELAHAEDPPVAMKVSFRDCTQHRLGYSIHRLPRYREAMGAAGRQVELSAALALSTGTECFVPTQLLRMDFRKAVHEQALFIPWSSGLAVGLNPDSAARHALYEVLERAVFVSGQQCLRKLAWDPEEWARLSPRIASLLPRLDSSGLEVRAAIGENTVGVPAVEVTIWGERIESPAFFGTGCGPNLTAALESAFLEAAQSRITAIAGAREDIRAEDYVCTARPDEAQLFAATDARVLPLCGKGELSALVRRVESLPHVGPVLRVDLKRSSDLLSTVHVVVPGLV